MLMSLLHRRFRPTLHYQLVEWHQLSASDRGMLATLAATGDIYGLFLPVVTAPHLTVKVAYADTAFLYLHLQKTSLLPQLFLHRYNESLSTTLARLVLDEVLEIEYDTSFVSGSLAVEALYGAMASLQAAAPSFLSQISMQLIANAFLLRRQQVSPLAQWLYTGNTMPWPAAAKALLATTQQVSDFLFSEAGETKRSLEELWHFRPPHHRFSWFSWINPNGAYPDEQPVYKLFISPVPEQMPAVLRILFPVLANSEAFSCKAGATVQNLLRPDKLIVYFRHYNDLCCTASALQQKLADCGVQGTPFTCQLDNRGLLSWGLDPASPTEADGEETGSWRTEVTEQLALAILQAKEGNTSVEQSLPFLKAKLQTAGVNMADWSPIVSKA